jgi:hypothetical protein
VAVFDPRQAGFVRTETAESGTLFDAPDYIRNIAANFLTHFPAGAFAS